VAAGVARLARHAVGALDAVPAAAGDLLQADAVAVIAEKGDES
jgi:hypothetical protein